MKQMFQSLVSTESEYDTEWEEDSLQSPFVLRRLRLVDHLILTSLGNILRYAISDSKSLLHGLSTTSLYLTAFVMFCLFLRDNISLCSPN